MSTTLVVLMALFLGGACLGSFETALIIHERIQTYKQGNKTLVWIFSAIAIISFVGYMLLYKYFGGTI